MRKASGFTLIEILIVIGIISIVTSVALISINRNENRYIESFTNELMQLVTLAEEQAMLQPSVLGLSLDKSSYHFASYLAPFGDKKTSWTPLQDKLLGRHIIPDDLELNVEMAGQKQAKEDENIKNIPQIIISTNGDITPFKIYVGKKGKAPRYLIQGEANGNIVSKMLS